MLIFTLFLLIALFIRLLSDYMKNLITNQNIPIMYLKGINNEQATFDCIVLDTWLYGGYPNLFSFAPYN